MLKIFSVFLLITNFAFSSSIQTRPDSTLYYIQHLKKAIHQNKSLPNKSYSVLSKSLEFFKKERDTINAIEALHYMADIQFQKSKYSLSFDHTWEALYLAKRANKKIATAIMHIKLAKLYDVFSMNNEVFYHLKKSLKIAKDIYFENEKEVGPLIGSYMNLAVKERNSGNYSVALKYLDSCLVNETVIENKQVEMPFIDAERGYIMLKLGNYKESDKFLQLSDKYARTKEVDYRTNLSLYLGELKVKQKQEDSAIYYFKRGLNLVNTKDYRPDLKPKLLYNLSELYFKKRNTIKAYRYLDESRIAADSMLQLKNQTNGELFEIKDGYLKSIYKKNEQLARQELEIAENKQVQFKLKIIVVMALLLLVILSIVYKMRLKLKRTLIEKKETELQAKLQEEQTNAKIEVKSKELTSYALQLIDKEKDIEELLEVLKNEAPKSFKSLSYKYTKGSKDLWDTFNLRFTEVNSMFYERLKEKHPDLSVTERKHCALIKLNFGTKEMAKILNIEPHSVHISRSRIRKKLGLVRSDKLENYISKF